MYQDEQGYDAAAYGDAGPYGDASGYGDTGPYGDAGPDDAAGYGDEAAEFGSPYPEDGAAGKSKGKKKRGKKPKQPRGGAGERPAKAAKGSRPSKQARPAARGSGPGPKLYFGAAAVLGLVVLLGLGSVFVLGGGDPPDASDATNAQIGTPAGTGLSPASYSSSSSTSAYSGIASRSSDPEPLTIEEAFPASAAKVSIPEEGVQVKLRAKRLDGDCADAVWGESVGESLGKGGCTQAARGIYSDTKNGYGLAVAVFNLSGSAAADRFVATLEETLGGGFVRPLEAKAPLDDFGRGFGMARGLSMGHFAVVTWAQRLDGKGDAKDETLLSLLIEGGKNPAVLGRAARSSD